MIIMRISGGFASQFGKYSFALQLAKSKGTELLLDISDYLNGYFRPLMLEYLELGDVKFVDARFWKNKVETVSTGERLIELYEQEVFPDIYLNQEEDVYGVFFKVYPQFIISPEWEVFTKFRLKNKSSFVERFHNSFFCKNVIGVHVRRGDFIAVGWENQLDEYKAAIGFLLNQHPDAIIIFFSNDISWIKEQFGPYQRYYYMENDNGSLGDIEDFICLSMCRYKVISARSVYSRYSNYLGQKQFGFDAAISAEQESIERKAVCYLTCEQLRQGLHIFNNAENIRTEDYQIIFPEKEKTEQTGRTNIEKTSRLKMKNSKKIDKDNARFIGKTFIVVSFERLNLWYENGMFLLAIMLASAGAKTLYVNVNPRPFQELSEGKIVPVKNMDGLDLNVDSLYLNYKLADVREIAKQWDVSADEIQVITDTVVSSDKRIIRIYGYDFSKSKLGYELRMLKNKLCIVRTSKAYYFWKKNKKHYHEIDNEEDILLLARANQTKIMMNIQ